MDLEYSDEQRMLAESIREFIRAEYDLESRREILERPGGHSKRIWKLFAALDWLTIGFAEEDGGFGDSVRDVAVVMEEFGRGLVAEPFLETVVLAGGLLSLAGSPSQKSEWLPRIMRGETQLALAHEEPRCGNDLARVATTAVLRDGRYLVDGRKTVVLNGETADQLLVTVRTSGQPGDRSGISLLLVAAETQGIERRGYPILSGKRVADIEFRGVDIPAENLVGAPDSAYAVLREGLDRAILASCAEAVGAMGVALDKTVAYSKSRQQFGRPIGKFQALQHRMADMFIEHQQAKSILLMAVSRFDQRIDQGTDEDSGDGSGDGSGERTKAVSAAKSRIGRAARQIGQEAIQIHGAMGVSDETDVGLYFKSLTVFELLFGSRHFHTQRFASM